METKYSWGVDYTLPIYGIYVIKCEKYYKIGKTTNIKNRLITFKISNPFTLELIIFKVIGQSFKTDLFEKKLHRKYEKYNHYGEWFKLPKLKVVSLIDDIQNG